MSLPLPSGAARRLGTLVLVSLAAGAPLRAASAPPLPLFLLEGWEASDGDPPGGVDALETLSWRPADPLHEPGPRNAVRWYRIRVDLTAYHGQPLALYMGTVRDVDETYLDGVRIGGVGSFPPRLDPASIQPRLYPLPTDLVNRPGTRVLALRVYHHASPSSVFRFRPAIDRLSTTHHRATVDQTLAALVAVALSLACALFFFQRGAREKTASPAFAGFALTMALYWLSGHSAWVLWPVPQSVPFRVAAVSAVLVCVCYSVASWRVLGQRVPWRFRAYVAAFLVYAAAAMTIPDLGWLVGATWMVRVLSLLCVADLVLPTLRAARTGNRAAWALLGGHLLFGVAIVCLNFMPSRRAIFASAAATVVLVAGSLYVVGLRQTRARSLAVLGERGRISRDIHDTLAQGLLGISLHLESLAETLSSSPETARWHLERARAQVRRSLEEARRSVWDLRPEPLDGRDLVGALTHLGHEVARGSTVRVQVEARGEPRVLSGVVEANLLRIGQEALTNAVKHARAREIKVELLFEARGVRLHVRDDGQGLDALDGPGGHFGLRGMRERAEQLGGALTVSSVAGVGTEIAVALPAS